MHANLGHHRHCASYSYKHAVSYGKTKFKMRSCWCDTQSTEDLWLKSQLRWSGYLVRLNDERVSKILLMVNSRQKCLTWQDLLLDRNINLDIISNYRNTTINVWGVCRCWLYVEINMTKQYLFLHPHKDWSSMPCINILCVKVAISFKSPRSFLPSINMTDIDHYFV